MISRKKKSNSKIKSNKNIGCSKFHRSKFWPSPLWRDIRNDKISLYLPFLTYGRSKFWPLPHTVSSNDANGYYVNVVSNEIGFRPFSMSVSGGSTRVSHVVLNKNMFWYARSQEIYHFLIYLKRKFLSLTPSPMPHHYIAKQFFSADVLVTFSGSG